MSLQVWLPLNGDLHNQGLANITATNNGATVDNNGKIGKCYRFGTAKSFLELPVEAMNDFTTECTVSFWLKILTRNTGWDTYFQAGLGGTAWNNYVFGFLRNNSNKCCFTVSGEAGTSSGSFVTSDMELNTWYHITLVYQTGHCLIYMDGMLYHDYSTAIVPAFNNITTITIGCANTKTNYQSNCLLNDLRIYDHALSPLEVRHLAQGLVLHYPLNRGGFGGDNIIAGTSPNEIQYTYPSSSYSDKFSPITTIVPTASQYTLSFWAKSTVNGDKVNSHYYSPNTTTTCVSNQGISRTSSDGNMIFTLSTDWEYYWVTYTQTETTAVKHVIFPRMAAENNQYHLSCIGSGTISVKCVKFEEGDTPTPWIPNQADDLYSQMGLDNNIEYDVSGYGNNGTRVGTFSWSGDTPRYNVSTYASGSASTYLSGSTLPTEAKTVSLWIKCNKTVDSAIFSDKTSGLQIGLLHSLLYINSLASTPGFTTTHWVNDEWNHVVAINDNGNRSVYINGQPETQSGASNYYIHNNDNFYLWKREYNNYYTYTGALSDLRIYATALSADDVMALYKNAGYVDSDGNVYAYEITE